MAGSTFGRLFQVTTWGESHGKSIGVVVDGCPAGLPLTEADIQIYLDRRKPGQSQFTTKRNEADQVEILSGVFEGRTTGTPISLIVHNTDQRSRDYGDIATYYRPGHADYTFDEKYGFRDYRGGGRSSGRETIGRVAAGAIAAKVLKEFGIELRAYTTAIGPVQIDRALFDFEESLRNPVAMPDVQAAEEAQNFLRHCIENQDSAGGIVECEITGVPAGIGDPVFEKLDANLAKAILTIGAVKGFEIGDGFAAATSCGSANNDAFAMNGINVEKVTNHSGGTLGGISDGSTIVFRAAFKPTPSISRTQKTVNKDGDDIEINIHGRHDPIIVPRAVVVVECMASLTILDLMMTGMSARLDRMKDFYSE